MNSFGFCGMGWKSVLQTWCWVDFEVRKKLLFSKILKTCCWVPKKSMKCIWIVIQFSSIWEVFWHSCSICSEITAKNTNFLDFWRNDMELRKAMSIFKRFRMVKQSKVRWKSFSKAAIWGQSQLYSSIRLEVMIIWAQT